MPAWKKVDEKVASPNCLLSFLVPLSPGVLGHVLRQVGQQHREVEANSLAWLVIGVLEASVVDLPLVVFLGAEDQELDLLPDRRRQGCRSMRRGGNIHGVILGGNQPLLHLLAGDGAIAVLVHFLEVDLVKDCLR